MDDFGWGMLIGIMSMLCIAFICASVNGCVEHERSYVQCHNMREDRFLALPNGLELKNCEYEITPSNANVRCYFVPVGRTKHE